MKAGEVKILVEHYGKTFPDFLKWMRGQTAGVVFERKWVDNESLKKRGSYKLERQIDYYIHDVIRFIEGGKVWD